MLKTLITCDEMYCLYRIMQLGFDVADIFKEVLKHRLFEIVTNIQ